MKKTILLLFISVLFTCNDESSDDNNSENTTIENDINCSRWGNSTMGVKDTFIL